MKMEIIKEKENPFLHRKELNILIECEKTPSSKQVLELIAANKGASEDAICIDKINQKFGERKAACYVKIYENKEFKEKFEPKKKLKEKTEKEKPEEKKTEKKEEVEEK